MDGWMDRWLGGWVVSVGYFWLGGTRLFIRHFATIAKRYPCNAHI